MRAFLIAGALLCATTVVASAQSYADQNDALYNFQQYDAQQHQLDRNNGVLLPSVHTNDMMYMSRTNDDDGYVGSREYQEQHYGRPMDAPPAASYDPYDSW